MGNRLVALLVCLSLLAACNQKRVARGVVVGTAAGLTGYAIVKAKEEDKKYLDRAEEREVFLESTLALHPVVVATNPAFVTQWLSQADKLGLRATVSALIAGKKAEYDTAESVAKAAMEEDAYDEPYFESPIRLIKSRPRAINPPKRKKPGCIALHGCEER